MKRFMIACLLAGAVICGCVPSIHGIATEETTVWDEQLLGKWGDADKADDPNAEFWQFEKGQGDGRYRLLHSDKGKVGEFDAVMVQLGDMLFLDLFPGENDDLENVNELYRVHLVRAHLFIRVDELGEKLKLRFMDVDDVKELVKENPAVVKHETRDDEIILTADTEELQYFLLRYGDEIFGDKDGDSMTKIAPATDE